MPTRMILPLRLEMLVLPVFPQDEDTSEVSDRLADLMKIAEQGDAHFQDVLGSMYEFGLDGVPQDHEEAVRWYRAAAEQGDAAAQFHLGSMYGYGKGLPQDYKEAVRWYREAAEQGQASAQNSLGFSYTKGQGVPQDYVLAHLWYNLAAASGGDEGRREGRERAARNRDMVAEEMTAEQIAEAQRQAREWRPKTGSQ